MIRIIFNQQNHTFAHNSLSLISKVLVYALLAVQREIKRCTRYQLRLLPRSFAMVPANDAGDRCQSDTRALEIPVSMESLEGRKQPVHILHVEPGTVITG